MLIVVEDRDWHGLFEAGFDFEAVRAFDIFEIDTTKRGSELLNGGDKVLCVFSLEAKINGIETSKFFEKNTFTFHHRFTC